MNTAEPIYSKSVLEMFTVANEYSIFIEQAAKYDVADVYNYLIKVLPLMYLKGAMLPEVIVEYPEANERFVTGEQWQDIFNDLRNKFGSDDTYLYCEPEGSTDKLHASSLAENIADIYQDMKDFTLLYSKESQAARENAVAEITRLFKIHWGSRAATSLRHIHFLLFGDDLDEETF
jgi:hypothetical protein